METPQANPRWKGLGTRIAGIIPLLIIAIVCVMLGGIFFSALVLLVAILMLKEWDLLTAREKRSLTLFGYPLIITPCACLLWMRGLSVPGTETLGFKLVLSLIVIIAATDIGAYFTGKRFGKHKLAPVLSPNKTWEGLGGGAFFAMIAMAFLAPLPIGLFSRLGAGLLLACLAQTGDILESSVKRRAGVKDSGALIPGHGGLLDRMDGYLLAAPAYALLVYYSYS